MTLGWNKILSNLKSLLVYLNKYSIINPFKAANMSQKIRSLQIIHLAICGGVIITYFMIGKISIEGLKKITQINSSEFIYLTIPIAAYILGNFIYKSQLKQADPKAKPEDQLGIYQTASIIRWAILEAVAFFILFSKPEYIALGILVIAYLLFLRPTEEGLLNDLKSIQ